MRGKFPPHRKMWLAQGFSNCTFTPVTSSNVKSSSPFVVAPTWLPSLKLTARTWKWMVGRRSFPFGKVTFQGRTVSFREGKSSFSYHHFHYQQHHHLKNILESWNQVLLHLYNHPWKPLTNVGFLSPRRCLASPLHPNQSKASWCCKLQ